jgi:glycosyltransferase involved in cell wall biosynthesis
VDTGSSDDTPRIVESELAGVEGRLFRRPWVDFGSNRNEALELARDRADYLFQLDADEEVILTGCSWKQRLEQDRYLVRYEGEIETVRPLLFRAACPWRYEGPIHEILVGPGDPSTGLLRDIAIRHHGDGGNADGKAERYRTLLLRAVAQAPRDGRLRFHLANAHARVGDERAAAVEYRRASRCSLSGELEYVARCRRARSLELMGTYRRAAREYHAARRFRPARVEALYRLSALEYRRGRTARALALANAALALPPNPDLVWVDRSVSAYRLPLLHLLCLRDSGQTAAFREACRGLQARSDIPPLLQTLLGEAAAPGTPPAHHPARLEDFLDGGLRSPAPGGSR